MDEEPDYSVGDESEERHQLQEGQNRGSGRGEGSRGRKKGKGKGKPEDKAEDQDDGRPEAQKFLCSLHKKMRFLERLEKRGDGWCCRKGDRCRNVDEVQCIIHHRWRSMQNMEKRGENSYACRPDCECR